MYKPKSKKEEPAASHKVRLPTESAMPTLQAIKAQFEEVCLKRGSIVELPWTTDVPSQQFILMGQWDKGAEFPVWTLYEENQAASTMHWSQTFPPSDLQLLYDVMAMSAIREASATAKIPDNLKAKSSPQQAQSGSSASSDFASQSAPTSIRYTHPSQQPAAFTPEAPPVPTPQPGLTQPSASQHAAMGYPLPLPPQTGYPPTMPVPQGYGYPSSAQPGIGYLQAGQPMGYPPMPVPYPAPPGNFPYPPAYPYGTPPVQAAPTAEKPPASSRQDMSIVLPVDYRLFQKGQNILLGALLVEAGLITEPSLEAALKLQEMVRSEKMPPNRAGEALRRLHTMGSSIDQYLNAADFRESVLDESLGQAQSSPVNGAVAVDAKDQEETKAAFDLLITAGLLTIDDIKTAFEVCSKHGGNIIQILVSAGKIPKSTYDAAVVCQSLIKDGLMKKEQCIIALNYCCRSRVEFNEALEELGWTNPRRDRKDTSR